MKTKLGNSILTLAFVGGSSLAYAAKEHKDLKEKLEQSKERTQEKLKKVDRVLNKTPLAHELKEQGERNKVYKKRVKVGELPSGDLL